MSLLVDFLRSYYKTGWRGSFRLTDILAARIKSLQCIEINTENGIVYADLRSNSSRGLLAQPKSTSGEDLVMKQFIKKGDTVLDIGAHLGFYTLLMSKLVGNSGKVCAFEPNPQMLKVLNFTLKTLKNTELFNVALSSSNGNASFYVPEDASMASLGNWTNNISDKLSGSVHQIECKTQRLDDLIAEKNLAQPSFIKCDVEGAEPSVFDGAAATLNREDAPTLLFEINAAAAKVFGKTSESYFRILESFKKAKYKFYEVLPGGLKPVSSTRISYANILTVSGATPVHLKLLPS